MRLARHISIIMLVLCACSHSSLMAQVVDVNSMTKEEQYKYFEAQLKELTAEFLKLQTTKDSLVSIKNALNPKVPEQEKEIKKIRVLVNTKRYQGNWYPTYNIYDSEGRNYGDYGDFELGEQIYLKYCCSVPKENGFLVFYNKRVQYDQISIYEGDEIFFTQYNYNTPIPITVVDSPLGVMDIQVDIYLTGEKYRKWSVDIKRL